MKSRTGAWMGGEWLVPFKGRKFSGAYNQNFLWRSGNVYVMDNHRAAMWCWFQHVDPTKPHSLFHIDRHYDCLQSRLDEWLEQCPNNLTALSIQEYLDFSYDVLQDGKPLPVISWDNYLSIYLAKFGASLKAKCFSTHEDGDKPNVKNCQHYSLWDLPEDLDGVLASERAPWIFNLDLDYFFWRSGIEDNPRPGVMVSDEYLQACCKIIRQKLKAGDIGVLTMALTPGGDFTGPWEASEALATKVLGYLGIDFKL